MTVTTSVTGAREVTVAPETLTFTAGNWDTEQTVTVSASRDADGEDDDQAEVTHAVSGGDYDGVTGGTVAVAVRDDGVVFEGVSLSVDVPEVAEADDARTVTVTAMLDVTPLPDATVVTVAVESGTATEVDDFAAVDDFTITIPANQTQGQGTFELSPVADIVDEGEGETVKVSGTTVVGLLVKGTEVTITDDDATETAVTLTVSPESVPEDAPADRREVTVTAAFAAAARPEDTEVALTVSAGTALQRTDFAAVEPFVLTIPAGSSAGRKPSPWRR